MTSKTIQRLLTLAALTAGLQSIDARAQSQTGDKPMDHIRIQAAIDANNDAVAAKDMDGILATYEPGAIVAGQPGQPAAGTEAIRATFNYFLALNPKITVLKQEAFQTGDIALHVYTWTMSGKSPDGTAVEQRGLSTIVLRKQPGGQWLIVIDNPFGDHLARKE